jgi:hypothetical protein
VDTGSREENASKQKLWSDSSSPDGDIGGGDGSRKQTAVAVIASVSEAIQSFACGFGLLRRFRSSQ